MATTYFVGINVDPSSFDQSAANLTVGTTTTATCVLELRMNSSTVALDRAQVLKGLEMFHRWVVQGGVNQAGANLPLPTGAG